MLQDEVEGPVDSTLWQVVLSPGSSLEVTLRPRLVTLAAVMCAKVCFEIVVCCFVWRQQESANKLCVLE
jgi:hypothetical protein